MLMILNARVAGGGGAEPIPSDIFIKDGKIAPLSALPPGGEPAVIDAAGLVASPGLVDMHVHFRDPGFLHKEDLHSGARAAAAGGVTTAVCMPNTSPVLDDAARLADVLARGQETGIHILAYGALSVGQQGKQLADAAALKAAGAVGLSDDGMPVQNAALLRAAMQSARALGLFISSHCEDFDLVADYAVNEGAVSAKLGLPGRPAVAESIMAARDVLLARETGARVHIAHVSAAETVEIIRLAKAGGIPVTAETCPQYFMLTEDAVLRLGARAKVNPPLRTQRDVDAVIEGLRDGTIDAIATDHAPHSEAEKSRPLTEAPSGISGLETSLAASLTALYHTGLMSLEAVLRLLSRNPAGILGINKGRINVGDDADIVLFDPEEAWVVDPARFHSRGRSTPFSGMTLRGRVKYTLAGGHIVYKGD